MYTSSAYFHSNYISHINKLCWNSIQTYKNKIFKLKVAISDAKK